jgi:hypothetical protein
MNSLKFFKRDATIEGFLGSVKFCLEITNLLSVFVSKQIFCVIREEDATWADAHETDRVFHQTCVRECMRKSP